MDKKIHKKGDKIRVIVIDESNGEQLFNEQAEAFVAAIAITDKKGCTKDETKVAGLNICNTSSAVMGGVVMTLDTLKKQIIQKDPMLLLASFAAKLSARPAGEEEE